ncbi:hypothetical protein NDU88_006805 [Pleurodeles waltl]|uniref:Uncharacterized protein n=1 Tax=Pleurodeles waltl TaxID=8319 RepID=A0AAV7VSK8_PLEWA|nr:hypothetical protein NDU88_006805 [Pleurodeles waltl]
MTCLILRRCPHGALHRRRGEETNSEHGGNESKKHFGPTDQRTPAEGPVPFHMTCRRACLQTGSVLRLTPRWRLQCLQLRRDTREPWASFVVARVSRLLSPKTSVRHMGGMGDAPGVGGKVRNRPGTRQGEKGLEDSCSASPTPH